MTSKEYALSEEFRWQTNRFGVDESEGIKVAPFSTAMDDFDNSDPRIVASRAEMKAVGFSMEMGRYYYL